MKRMFLIASFAFTLFGLPATAQQVRPQVLDQAAGKLRELAPNDAQAQGLMNLFLRELPHIMDENFDPLSLAKQIQPEAERLLRPEQIQMLQKLESEAGSARFGRMTREERRALVRGGLERLSHPDMQEWLRRIDSFEI